MIKVDVCEAGKKMSSPKAHGMSDNKKIMSASTGSPEQHVVEPAGEESGKPDASDSHENQEGKEKKPSLVAKNLQIIEPDPNSVVSDYSEINESVKEHLANVQIIQKEDLDSGNSMFANSFQVQQAIKQGVNETDEEFSRRLRKINYLSLAQEFAELKKMDADATPFDFHTDVDDYSPMSEGSTESDSEQVMTDSSAATPVDEEAKSANYNKQVNEDMEDVIHRVRESSLTPMQAWIEATSDHSITDNITTETNHKIDNPTDNVDNQTKPLDSERLTSTIDNEPKNSADSINTSLDFTDNDKKYVTDNTNIDQNQRDLSGDPDAKPNQLSPTTPDVAKTCVKTSINDQPDDESKPASIGDNAPNAEEKLDDFDVYNIETAMPKWDWATLEQQIKQCAEEERKQRSRHNDREQIRRKLAMGSGEEESYLQTAANRAFAKKGLRMSKDEEYYAGERVFKKPNLGTRLQGGMNLQLCYMNDSGDSEEQPLLGAQTKQLQPVPKDETSDVSMVKSPHQVKQGENESDADFATRQAKMQDEARMALAQVRPMAHMQLMVEKMAKKKSPIVDIVGLAPALSLQHQMAKQLCEMNIAQLQVLVNDLHSQIESFNEELVQMLMQRDELHMEQDSMLVDIEDLSRRAKERSRAARNQKLGTPKKSAVKR